MHPVPETSPARRARRAALVLVAAGAVALAACGGSTSSSGGGTTTTVAANDPTAKLKDLSANVQAAKNKTFKAVYTSTDSGGTTQTITLAQSPPKQLFSTSGGGQGTTSLINTGSTTYTCTTDSSGSSTCTSIASGVTSNALSSVIALYNGSTALTAIQSWQAVVAEHLAGYSLTFSDETIGGQSSTCANWSYQGQKATYCVTSDGVLAKVQSSGSSGSSTSFELTSYTTSVSDAEFALPQGATVVTLPSGVSVP